MSILDITPPTDTELKGEPDDKGAINPLDILEDVPPGTTPKLEGFKAEVPKLPSRVTGEMEGDAPEGYEGFMPDYLGDVVRGANDFILALPDGVINLTADALEAAGVVEPNTVDRDYLKRIFNSSDFESQKVIVPYLLHYGTGERIGQVEEEGKTSAILRGAGQGAIASLPIIGMQLKAAGIALPTAAETAMAFAPSTTSTTARVAEQLTKPFRTSPAASTAIETVASAASGAGIVGEKEFFGTETGIGGLAPLAPAGIYYLAPKLPGVQLAKKGFNWGKNAITGGAEDKKIATGALDPGEGVKGAQAKGELADEIEAAVSTPEGQSNIQKAAEIEATIGAVADEPIILSPAERTMDPPLLTTQARIEAKGDPDFTRKNLARKNNIITATQKFIDNELTGSPIDDAPLFIYDRATNNYTTTIGRLDDEAAEVTTKWSMLTNDKEGVYPKLSSRAEAGSEIRNTIVKAENDAKEAALKLAKKLKINDADPVGDANATSAAQAAVRSSVTSRAGEEALSYQGLPPLVRAFIEKKFKNGRMSFQDWKDFRDQVGSAIGKAAAVNDKASIRPLAILSDSLDDLAKSFGKTNEKFEDFRVYYDANVVTPYQRSGVIKVTAKGQGNKKDAPEYHLPDEEVAAAFLQNTNAAKQFMTLFSDSPAQLRHMKAVVLDQVRNKAYIQSGAREGTFDPAKINTYVNQNREVLDVLNLTDAITNPQVLIKETLSRNAELEARRRIVNGNLLNKSIVRAMNNDSPEKLFDDALNSPAKMRELKQIATKGSDEISAEDAGHAFRAAVTERMLAKAPDALEKPADFKQWIVRNEEVLNAAFDKSHLDNLYLIADAAERVLATGFQSGAGVSPADLVTKFTGALGTTPAGISNRFIAVQEGRLGSKAMVGYILSRAIRQRSTVRSDALFREAMFDPDIAKLLATEGGESVPAFGISEPNKRRVNSFLFNLGVDYGGDFGEGPTQEFEFKMNVPTDPIVTTPPPTPKPTLPQKQIPKRDPNFPQNLYPPVPQTSTTPPAPPLNTAQVGIETLFPNDPTSIAIAKRRGAGQGAMRTV